MHPAGAKQAAFHASPALRAEKQTDSRYCRWGSEVTRGLISVLVILKTLPTSKLDDALDGLARVLGKGLNLKAMRRVLDNTRV